MPVDATWRLQSNSGTVTTASTGFTPTLPNPTQPGSTLLLIFAGPGGTTVSPWNQGYDPPWFQELTPSLNAYWWRRDNQPAGETSWPLTGSLSSRWAWHMQEWAGMSTVAQPDAGSSITTAPPAFAACALGTQACDLATASLQLIPDVTDYAALFALKAGPDAGGGWPAAWTFTSGWSQVDALQVGTGTSSSPADFMLAIAEAYPGTTGSLDPALTWDITGGGSYSGRTCAVGAACYQPAPAPPPAEVLTG